MLLNKSYFTGQLEIAQLTEKSVRDHLTRVISQVEPEVLQAALGYDLYDEYMAGIDVGSDEVVDDKWINLTDGLVFANTGSLKQLWKGFANEAKLRSVVAPFVWCRVIEELSNNVTGIGIVSAEPENASKVNPAVRLSEVWNQGTRDMEMLWEYLDANTTVYTTYKRNLVNEKYFRRINPMGL